MKEIFKEFDGYDQILEEIKVSRKHWKSYAAEAESTSRHIALFHPHRISLRVLEIIEETPTTKTIRLVPENRYLPPFLAGQYLALFLEIGGIRTTRPYSISSPPNQRGYYDITVRRVENGLVSNYLLDDLVRGDKIESSGPAGNFYFNPLFHDKVMVCIAGGSGITPFMSMIREITQCGLGREVFLFYGNKTTDDIIFHEELTHLSGRFNNIHYIPVIQEPPSAYEGPSGLITGELIKEILGDLAGKTFYLCGPKGLYDFCIPELEKLNVPLRKIRKEIYGQPQDIAQYPGWPQSIKTDDKFSVKTNRGNLLEAKAGEPLLVALERAGVLVPSMCRSGECSMCRIKITSGKVFQPHGVPVRKSDREFGYIHSCVSYPLSDLEIII